MNYEILKIETAKKMANLEKENEKLLKIIKNVKEKLAKPSMTKEELEIYYMLEGK